MLKTKIYQIPSSILTNKMLEAYITNFWLDIFTKLVAKSNKHLLLMCKVQFANSLGYRTLGQLRRVNFSDKELFIEYLLERLGLLTEAYTTNPISKITFTYIIQDGLATKERKLLESSPESTLSTHRFNNIELPITMDPLEYGELRSKSVHEGFTRYLVKQNNRIFEIDVLENGQVNSVTILGGSELNWRDTLLEGGGFVREIGKSTIYFVDGQVVLRKQQLPAKPFTRLSKDTKVITRFVTMDIETTVINSKIVPYLIL